MVRQIVWLGAIGFLSLVASFFLVTAAHQTWTLLQLNSSTEAVILEWHAKEGDGGYYYPFARFTYQVGSRNHEATSYYSSGYARNPYALEPALVALSEKTLTAYYDARNPQDVLLEKNYPYKEWLKGAVALGVAAYFFVLKRKRALL